MILGGGGGNPRFLSTVKPCWVCLKHQHKSVDHNYIVLSMVSPEQEVTCFIVLKLLLILTCAARNIHKGTRKQRLLV